MENENIRKPKNTKEIFQWLFFEPELLEKYSARKTTIRQRWDELWRPYLWVIGVSIFLWLVSNFIIAIFDLPVLFSGQFKESILSVWHEGQCLENFLFYCGKTVIGLYFGLALLLVFGLVLGLVRGLYFGLAYGLYLGLVLGLAIGLVFGLAVGLASGLVFGLDRGLVRGLYFRLVFGLALGLIFGLYFGLALGLVLELAFFVSFINLYYRIPTYLYYVAKNQVKKYSLQSNPHIWDGVIAFPIWKLKDGLTKEALSIPSDAQNLIDHLFENRKHQRPLAFHLLHAQTSGYWKQNRLDFNILKKYPEVPDEKDKSFRPSESWYEKLNTMRQARLDSATENNIHTRLNYFGIFREKLNEFRQQNLLENPKWNKYYFETLDLWVKSANEEYERLKLIAEMEEPIAPNIYRGGERLNPQFDKDLFFGRNDLRNDFKNKVLTATSMPLFFIQGQRRVGKSSLIHFLPEFLDSGFIMVYLDLQSGITSVEEWLIALRKEIWKTVNKSEVPEAEPLTTESWLMAWKQFQSELEEIAKKDGRRIILAMDEYEELHRCLQIDPTQAGQILGAMRSFSQSQNKVVFLFAGADYFTELKSPNWNEYFVQAVPLRVDYLNREDSFKLIQVVPLRYPEPLLERMYFETQGHPCLLQKICQEIVNIANADGRKDMAEADYEKALDKIIRQPSNGVVDVFWGQFCELRDLKDTVLEILNRTVPSDLRKAKILKVHGFVLEEKGEWKMRVPMFEEWIRDFGDL